MVAYFFPPVGGLGAAGSQRVLKFAKYLPSYQWLPVILTIKEPYYESYLAMDPTLLDKVPAETKVARTSVVRGLTKILAWKKTLKTYFSGGANPEGGLSRTLVVTRRQDSKQEGGRYRRLKDAVTDLFEIPDEEAGWLFPGVYAGTKVIKKERIDVIYSTGRPWTAHLIGVILKRLTGKPLVTDFRDPWLTNPFRLAYSPLRNRLEEYLEKQVIAHADAVIANTEELRDEFTRRFPQQPHHKFLSLLNGFDPDDYTGLSLCDASPRKTFTITHTGFLYGQRDPATFLEAVVTLLERKRLGRQTVRIVFVGNVTLPYNLEEYLAARGLSDVVTLQEHVPHKHSLEYLQQSDVLLLLQPGTTTQVPSKLFEYIGMRKPILAVSPRGGATYNLVRKESLGEVAHAEDPEEIAAAVERMYVKWRGEGPKDTTTEEVYQKFDVRNITGLLANVFSQVSTR